MSLNEHANPSPLMLNQTHLEGHLCILPLSLPTKSSLQGSRIPEVKFVKKPATMENNYPKSTGRRQTKATACNTRVLRGEDCPFEPRLPLTSAKDRRLHPPSSEAPWRDRRRQVLSWKKNPFGCPSLQSTGIGEMILLKE